MAARDALHRAWEEYNLYDNILQEYPKTTLLDQDWIDAEAAIVDIMDISLAHLSINPS